MAYVARLPVCGKALVHEYPEQREEKKVEALVRFCALHETPVCTNVRQREAHEAVASAGCSHSVSFRVEGDG